MADTRIVINADDVDEMKKDTEIEIISDDLGVDFSPNDGRLNDKIRTLIRNNQGDPLLLAKFIVLDNPGIIRVIGGDNSVNSTEGILYKFNGKYYDFLKDRDLDGIILKFCMKYGVTKAFKVASGIIRALNVFEAIPFIKEINPHKDLISLNNGVLNIHTKEFVPHRADHFFDYALAIDYDSEAKDCPAFKKFLRSTFNNDTDTIMNIIRLGGYLLDSSTKAEKCFFFNGGGGNGKSILLDTFTMFFPQRSVRPVVSSLSLLQLSSSGFDKEDLIYSRLNQCAENKRGYYDAEFLKQMVSGDQIMVSRKYSTPFNFRYQGKIIISGNGLPNFYDTSNGIMRRILIFNFPNSYKPDHEIAKIKHADKLNIFPLDPTLRDRLREEAAGILNLFIEGLIDLRNNNYQFIESASSALALDEFRRDNDTIREFLEDNYVLSFETTPIALPEIFNELRNWYMLNVQDNRAMKFRSAELAKRIREVFNCGPVGRLLYRNPQSGVSERCSSYPLAKIDKAEPQEISADELPEETKEQFVQAGLL